MKLGTLLLGGVVIGGLVGAGLYSWSVSPTPVMGETPALAQARQDVVSNPDDVDAWVRVGDEARHVGDIVTARLAYRRVIDLEPTTARGHARLGIMLVDLGETEQARKHLTRAAELGSPDARFVLGGLDGASAGEEPAR